MKLLRIGEKGKEKPAILDKNSKFRDLSSHIKDFNSDNLNFETVSKLKNINLDTLPEIKNSERIGACISTYSLTIFYFMKTIGSVGVFNLVSLA